MEERVLLDLGGQRAEQEQQLAHIQRAPPQQHLEFSPLALKLSRSEGRHHTTMAQWCLWLCDGARQADPNKHADQL